MATVKDADGNVLNRTAPQVGDRYTDESALTQDWFAKHPRLLTAEEVREVEGLPPAAAWNAAETHPPYVDENDKTWLYNAATKDWDIPEVTDETPRSGDDVPSVQLPSERSDDGLAGEQEIPASTDPSGDTAGDVDQATSASN